MRELTAVLVALFLSVGFSHAQVVEVGLRGGANYATFKGETGALDQGTSEYGRRLGGRAGGLLLFGVTESFAVRTEVTYSRKGSTFDASNARETRNGALLRLSLDFNFKYDYLDIPILAEYSFETGSRFQPQVFAGPSIGFALSSNLDSEITATVFDQLGREREIDPPVESPDSPDIETTDIGAVIGGGVSYILDSGDSVFLDVRFNPSLTKVNSDGDADLENETITVGIGYSFSLR
jgi:opacity protein-like surface antigen